MSEREGLALASIIIIPPIIVPAVSEQHGSVPWWFWLVLAGAVMVFLIPVGWIAYDQWKWERRRGR